MPEHVPAVVDLGDHGRWMRRVITTEWLGADDDLLATARDRVGPFVHEADFVAVTEKVVSIAAGLEVDASEISVGALARFLARQVRPRGNSLALSVPEKMQWVVDELGLPRVLAASAASAITRPFGYDGAFYRIGGEAARAVDGIRGAYPSTLIPPLTPGLGRRWCDRLQTVLTVPIAIVDMNDRGGSVRATSPELDPALVGAVMADNPLRSGRVSTPIAVVSRVIDRARGQPERIDESASRRATEDQRRRISLEPRATISPA